MKVAYGHRRLAADGTAETTRPQQHDSLIDTLDEMMIEPGFAKLVRRLTGVKAGMTSAMAPFQALDQ
jgi:hypothetical protein